MSRMKRYTSSPPWWLHGDSGTALLYEISSSHGEYEAQNLLGCTAVFLTECKTIKTQIQNLNKIKPKDI
jgi:hypothetical protein